MAYDPERRHAEQTARLDRLFVPPAAESAPPAPPFDLDAFERAGRRQWAQERAARIRRGACPVCAERLCPRVGGPDRECVVG